MVRSGTSPYATRDPARHAEELGRLDPNEVHEFYGPFAMVPGLAELARVISPTYGEMDMIVILEPRPVRVYTNSETGERFLRERFPTVERFRVPEHDLLLEDGERGRTIVADLSAREGPLRELSLVVRAHSGAAYEAERYEGLNVWGSQLTCYGIDMRVAATARGMVRRQAGGPQPVAQDATLFRGSYGKLAPKPKESSISRGPAPGRSTR